LIDYKRLPSHIAKNLIDDKPFGSHRSLGSVALELCWLAAGRAQLYFHAKQHLWDYAAAELIL
jgi:myo-inositol-1(or 4)-monophosphatase